MNTEKESHLRVSNALAVMLIGLCVSSCGVSNPGYILPDIRKQMEDTPLYLSA